MADEGGQEKVQLSLAFQAPTEGLKQLFRFKDKVKSLVKESYLTTKTANDHEAKAVLVAFKVFVDHRGVYKEIQAACKQVFMEELKIEPDQDKLPVVKMFLALTTSEMEKLNELMDKATDIVKDSLVPGMDINYQVFRIVFCSVCQKRSKLYHAIGFEVALGIAPSDKCLICNDKAEVLYCQAIICVDCKQFFIDIMQRRTLLSLRCSKSGQCISSPYTSKKMVSDLSCRKCRYDRCQMANMVEQYCYTELPEFLVQACLICRKTEDIQTVLGSSLCIDCRQWLDDLAASNGGQEPRCLKSPSTSCAALECPKCVKDVLANHGLLTLHAMKSQGIFSGPCFSPGRCAVCNLSTNDLAQDQQYWMEIPTCLECRGFLQASLANGGQSLYCCPKGEVGRLCPLRDVKGRCSYCWFVRCEIEGLVERWQICQGDPSNWNKVINSIELESEGEEETTAVSSIVVSMDSI